MIEAPGGSTLIDRCKDIGGYFAAAVVTAVVLTITLQLWNADLTVPLRYDGGDSTYYLVMVKATLEQGWYLDNNRLGAPDGQNLRDFPTPDVLHFAIIKCIGYLTRNPIATANIYYLLPYPLTALTSYWTLRRFALARLAALTAGILYACAPYHFWRMTGHPMLAAYYLLPLSTWGIVRLYLGRLAFPWSNAAGAALICLLTGLGGVYYAFFTCFFLAAAGVHAALRDRQWKPIGAAAAYILVISATLGAALAPNIMYRMQHGRNPEAAWRSPAEADLYGLNVSEMLLPIEGHRLYSLARRRAKYLEAQRGPLSESVRSSPLGMVASAGFLWMIALFMWRRREKKDGIEDALAYLTVAAVALGSIGGVGASFNFSVTPMIRCYNRISIYIAFFALAGLFHLLDRLAHRIAKGMMTRTTYRAGLGAVLLFGIFDQTSAQYIPNYVEAKKQYNFDADFGQRMETALPEGSLVYQLPYVPFPEAGVNHNLPDYDLFRPYLHTKSLRWSYGGMKGRPDAQRQAAVAMRPLTEMLPELVHEGFRGVYLDRAGYADNGAAVEATLTRLLGVEPRISQTGRQVFFNMKAYIEAHDNLARRSP